MQVTLSNAEIRKLKAQAQRLEPTFKVGKAGLSDGFVKSIDEAFAYRELIKVKFVEFKEEKKTLAPELAEKTRSELIMRVGNVAVLYRRKPAAPPESPQPPV
ncbi:MAG: putative RNA-binding protein containing domain, ribosomal protein [Pedosphaera sp.]|nr:putative RNA-binding protein containing domain, ribosomal protein [Pedosphaera sp.]